MSRFWLPSQGLLLRIWWRDAEEWAGQSQQLGPTNLEALKFDSMS